MGSCLSTPEAHSVQTTTRELCWNCNTYPKYVDGDKTHDFCRKSCAIEYRKKRNPVIIEQQNGPYTGLRSDADNSMGELNIDSHENPPVHLLSTIRPICPHCNVHPRAISKRGKLYNHCSRECARLARGTEDSEGHSMDDTTTSLQSSETCSFCLKKPRNTAYKNSSFCGKDCVEKAKESGCIFCKKRKTARISGDFCSDCSEGIISGPSLIRLSKGHQRFKDIANQFNESWRHDREKGKVLEIFKVVCSATSWDAYCFYRSSVEGRGQFSRRGMSIGNERRRWHGTHRECDLGDNGNTAMCTLDACRLCSILRSSYKLAHFSANTKWGRFGKGIYASSTSSKADGYSNIKSGKNTKALLLNYVVVGQGHKLTANSENLSGPPPGFDSVLGETGKTLKFDEVVIYNENAIRPAYLVIYSTSTT